MFQTCEATIAECVDDFLDGSGQHCDLECGPLVSEPDAPAFGKGIGMKITYKELRSRFHHARQFPGDSAEV